jgi:hypothetical protein
VFLPLLSSSKSSGGPEDSKSPTLGKWVSSSHLAKVGLRHIVQPILKGMIQSITIEFIKPRCGKFIITRKWFKQFMKQYMCWTYHVATTITSKLPLDWFAQRCTMTYKVIYLVKTYSIRPTLVVNSNPTKVHFVPNGGPNNKIKSSFLIFFNDAHT